MGAYANWLGQYLRDSGMVNGWTPKIMEVFIESINDDVVEAMVNGE